MKHLWQRGLHLLTGIRRNQKNHVLPLSPASPHLIQNWG